ncbi:MAG: ACT domain-containing protein, partial [Patescibacteria group bacterium]
VEHLVVDDAEAAKAALEALGKKVSMSEILQFHCSDDRPGVIAAIARKLGDAGINIDNIYYSSIGRGQPAKVYVWVAKENFANALQVSKELE